MENCASCHGNQADGVPANGTTGAYPDLVGLGPATIDFWVDSGRMPATDLARSKRHGASLASRPIRRWRSPRG